MEVRLAALADFANVDAAGKVNIIGMFNELTADSFPVVVHAMFVALVFEAPPSEFGIDKTLSLLLIDSDGQKVIDMSFGSHTPSPTRSGAPAQINLVVCLNNVKIDRPGEYEFCVLVNGEQKKTLPLRLASSQEREQEIHP